MESTFASPSGGPGRGPPPSGEIECRSLRPADYPAVKEIIAESFPQALQANPKVLESLEQEPWYDPSHLFVAAVEGRPVSHMGVRDGLLWCSGVGVPAGLVGAVCTAPPLRGRGIGGQLMRASFCAMEGNGLAVSCLHTSPERYGFYSRLGYRKATIASPRLLLDLDSDKPGLDSGRPVTTRTATAADAGILHRIYAAHYSQVSGSWSRTVRFWERRLLQEPKLFGIQPLVFRVAPDRRPAAYVALLEGRETGTVSEWGCLPGAEDIAAGAAELHVAGVAEPGCEGGRADAARLPSTQAAYREHVRRPVGSRRHLGTGSEPGLVRGTGLPAARRARHSCRAQGEGSFLR